MNFRTKRIYVKVVQERIGRDMAALKEKLTYPNLIALVARGI